MDKQLSTKVRSLNGIFIMEGEKPNFSAIARYYNVDRHTVAKYTTGQITRSKSGSPVGQSLMYTGMK